MSVRTFASYLAIVSMSLVASIGLLFGLNWLAQVYLRANPEILMTTAERVNENTRAVRENLVSPEQAVLWYDLQSFDEVKPMWDERYSAGTEFQSYVHFRQKPLVGRYRGVTEAGYRMSRKSGPWPPSPDNFNLFFFGDSTAFGVGPYWATVASYLEDIMNEARFVDRPVFAYNFGQTSYVSSQEAVLFHNLISAGHRPDMAVFLDGLNDFCFFDGQPSSWQLLANHYDRVHDEHIERLAGHGIVTQWVRIQEFLETLPLVRLFSAWWTRATEAPIPEYKAPTGQVEEKPESEAVLRAVMSRYILNMRQVAAVSADMGIVPIFVWQPIPTYKYDTRHHVFNPSRLDCHVNSKFGYPIMARTEEKSVLGENFIWAADIQADLEEALYVDAFHYTAPMSKRIAEFVAGEIAARGLLGP